ncbi:MAG: tRNA uridine-5-carboxymethylaminomethyl(34) synthesis GTPase MnmE [Candidatus Poribacteria bacterium]|nr:tRNA uridine-5-carboxymethylaminomethyl(34) synthesis GTPase MnmE [Candidatus Poribacteria bacterium]
MKFEDTIAAIATPRGEGGIGIVRVSGPLAIPIASQLFRPSRVISPDELPSHTLTHGHVIDTSASDEIIDEVMLGIMRSPKTYTTEDIVEFNCHGGIVPLTTVLALVVKAGARLAEPGEFTKRAFLNGRLDLAQAEAVAELISSKTELSRKIAIQALEGKLSESVNQLSDTLAALLAEIEASIDFPDEDLDFMKVEAQLQTARTVQTDLTHLLETASEGRLIKEGVNVAILGKPNVGKSSLFNALVRSARAIVTDIPGTTRDTIDETINLDGIPINLIDTAGLRQTEDIVEQQGVQRSRDVLNRAEFLLLMFDASQPLNEADTELLQIANSHRAILILNKIDLPAIVQPQALTDHCPKVCIVQTAITEDKGIDVLKTAIREELLGEEFNIGESPIVTNTRHQDALRRAQEALDNVIVSLENEMPPDLVSVDLRISLDALGDIVGKTTTEDILDRIFSQFCVGK